MQPLDSIPLESDLRPLVEFLRGRGLVVPADDFDALAHDEDTPLFVASP